MAIFRVLCGCPLYFRFFFCCSCAGFLSGFNKSFHTQFIPPRFPQTFPLCEPSNVILQVSRRWLVPPWSTSSTSIAGGAVFNRRDAFPVTNQQYWNTEVDDEHSYQDYGLLFRRSASPNPNPNSKPDCNTTTLCQWHTLHKPAPKNWRRFLARLSYHLVPNFSGARFWSRIERCSISWHDLATTWSKYWFVIGQWSMLLLFSFVGVVNFVCIFDYWNCLTYSVCLRWVGRIAR